MDFLDSFLSKITMYRLMLYYLVALVLAAIFFSGLPPTDILIQTVFLLLTCYLTNLLFAKFFKVPTNFESFAITALILTLIIGPFTPRSLSEVGLLAFIATASKYLLVINKRHIFNPAALAAAIFSASWWIGSPQMLPFLILGGIIILAKLRRFSLALIFLILAGLLSPPLVFFAIVMLIEPQTSPVKTKWQILYAILVAVLFKFLPLEVSLLLGNVFSYLIEPTSRFVLKLRHKLKLNSDTFAFYFQPDRKLNSAAGQYLELTLSHPHSDSRGTRRFFTIASSPTEPELMIVSRFVENGSSFKKSLLSLKLGDQIFANGPSGEFTLAPSPYPLTPIVFIAGGIGITPFRSMIKNGRQKNITLLYFASSKADFLFKDIFAKADIKTVYRVGPVSKEIIRGEIPDLKDKIYYVSGPELMVEKTEEILRSLGVSRFKINRDHFPGY